jgi:Spy/CpxP family protein refolding chaperone
VRSLTQEQEEQLFELIDKAGKATRKPYRSAHSLFWTVLRLNLKESDFGGFR